MYPDDEVTRRLLAAPQPLTRARVRALWSLIRAVVFEERLRFHRPFTPAKPNGVAIEITNGCNLRCTMCNLVAMKRPAQLMEMNVFRRVVDRCAELGVENVRLHTYGETLLHPRLAEMLSYAKQKDLKVWVSTNAQLLSEKKARMLLESGVAAVRYSIDGADRESYEAIRVRGRWDRLTANIARFVALRDELSPETEIGLNSVVMRDTVGEIDRVTEVFSQYVDEIEFSPLEGLGSEGRRLSENRWIEDPDWRQRIPCRLLWDMMNITVDGKATLCCADLEAEVVVGDAVQEDLLSIWKGPHLEAARETHRRREFDQIEICRNCTFGTTNTAVNRFRYALLNDRESYGRAVR